MQIVSPLGAQGANGRKWKFVAVAALLFFAWKWWFRAPSEAQLKARFVEQRADFEQLRKMIEHDAPASGIKMSVSRDGDFTRGASLAPARIQRYQVLLKNLGATSVHGRCDDFHFSIFGGGFTDTTWGVGYAFSRQKPKRIVPSAYSGFAGRDEWIYSLLKDDWYLYRRH